MKRRNFLITGAAFLPALAFADPNGSKLLVHINYVGEGKWDKNHKMLCAVWKSPDFMTKSHPEHTLARMLVDPEVRAVTFEGIELNLVYVSVALDATGKWDGTNRPPVGSYIGLYGDKEPQSVHLSSNKLTTIDVTFGKPERRLTEIPG